MERNEILKQLEEDSQRLYSLYENSLPHEEENVKNWKEVTLAFLEIKEGRDTQENLDSIFQHMRTIDRRVSTELSEKGLFSDEMAKRSQQSLSLWTKIDSAYKMLPGIPLI